MSAVATTQPPLQNKEEFAADRFVPVPPKTLEQAGVNATLLEERILKDL